MDNWLRQSQRHGRRQLRFTLRYRSSTPPLSFKGDRRHVADSPVYALAVVEALDVLKDAGPGNRSGWVAFMVNQFRFEQGEETLHGRIVIAVANTAHAGQHLMLT